MFYINFYILGTIYFISQCFQPGQTTNRNVAHSFRGDYDYCRVPGTRQLSPLEVGEDNSKFEPKKLRKVEIHQYGQTKGCYRGFQAC